MRKIQRYGWRKDSLDHRDLALSAGPVGGSIKVDLRPQMPIPYDQGDLGSCTANGMASQIEFLAKKNGEDFMPSRLFIYYFERNLEGSVASDAGAEPRDGIKVLAADGAPPETEWPYDVSKFSVRPPQSVLHVARRNLVSSYFNLKGDLASMRWCLKSGYPFGFGFTVYQSFESREVAQTGIAPMPQSNEPPLGGHYVVAVGCDDEAQTFIIRNSWGTGWGMGGYCTMPYAYLTNPNLASDFWTLRSVVAA